MAQRPHAAETVSADPLPPHDRRLDPQLRAVRPEACAFLFDFDGVLVDLADRPDSVKTAPALHGLLNDLESLSRGAVSVVTGRSAADVRKYLLSVPGCVVASHGAERDCSGRVSIVAPPKDRGALARIEAGVADLASRDDGLLQETKPLGCVLHYRRAPHMGPKLRALMQALADRFPEFELHGAKMAWEIRLKGIGKDVAVAQLMSEAPFSGRIPIYFGDDATDEPAMAWVQDHGGMAVKVGAGETCAKIRLERPDDVRSLLEIWTDACPDLQHKRVS